MPAYTLPATKDPTKVTVNVFDRSAAGVPPEEFVLSLSQLNPASVGDPLAADDTYRGAVNTRYVAGVNLTQWQSVYLLPSGSVMEWQLADSDGSGTMPARGIVVANTTAGAKATVLTQGEVRNDAWAWTPGGNLYQSATPGTLTQTPPGSNVQAVGWASSADTVVFNFTATFRPTA